VPPLPTMTLVVAPLSMTPAQRERLNIPVGGEALVELALTHPSRRHQEGASADNERLEFLGDAILGAVVASRLYADDTAAEEGDLSERRAAVVSRTALAEVALRIGIDEVLMLGEGEASRGGARRPAALAAAFEALIGAIYLSHGFAAAATFIEGHMSACTYRCSTVREERSIAWSEGECHHR